MRFDQSVYQQGEGLATAGISTAGRRKKPLGLLSARRTNEETEFALIVGWLEVPYTTGFPNRLLEVVKVKFLPRDLCSNSESRAWQRSGHDEFTLTTTLKFNQLHEKIMKSHGLHRSVKIPGGQMTLSLISGLSSMMIERV